MLGLCRRGVRVPVLGLCHRGARVMMLGLCRRGARVPVLGLCHRGARVMMLGLCRRGARVPVLGLCHRGVRVPVLGLCHRGARVPLAGAYGTLACGKWRMCAGIGRAGARANAHRHKPKLIVAFAHNGQGGRIILPHMKINSRMCHGLLRNNVNTAYGNLRKYAL
jgi:hypothetical protein